MTLENLAHTYAMPLARSSLAFVLSASLAFAQESPTLREVGRTEAIGGDVVQCVFDGAGKHMLTVGDAGDLVWWDLATLQPLRRVPPIERYVTALALHPSEPWAVVAVNKDMGYVGSVHIVNLDTGELRPLWPRYATSLAFDGDGKQLAVLFYEPGDTPLQVFATGLSPLTAATTPRHEWAIPGHCGQDLSFAPDGSSLRCSDGQPLRSSHSELQIALADGAETTHVGATIALPPAAIAVADALGEIPVAVSADGTVVASLRDRDQVPAVDRLAPTPITWDCTPHVESWLEHVWVAPGGTIVTADAQGQLHVLGPAAERQRLASCNQGVATGLTWSPDSHFLAVQGMGALRVVDRTGRVMFELPGSHAVAPGTAGAEFVTADRVGMQCWNASVARTIGDDVAWHGGRPKMLTINRRRLNARDIFDDHFEYSPYGSTPIVPLPRGALFGCGRLLGDPAVSLLLAHADGALSTVSPTAIGGACSCIETGTGQWDARRNRALMTGFTPPPLYAIGGIGSSFFGTLRAFDADGCETMARGFEESVAWIAPCHHDARLLVGLDGGEVHELDAESFEPLAKWKLEAWTRWFFPLDDKLAIAGDGTRVLLFSMPTDDAGPQLLHPVSPPPGLGPVHLAALAPDRRHLALASGHDVCVVTIE